MFETFDWHATCILVLPYQPGETRRDTVDESLNHDDFFGVSKLFTRTELFESRVHLGHKEGLLDQRMKKYMIGTRREQCIMDLDQTAPLLNSALNFTAHIAYRNGIILFVNRVPQFAHAVEEMARACGEYAHTRHWQKGCFTNAQIQMGPGTRLPDLIIFLNTLNDVFSQHQAVVDAAKMNIPTIAIVDSNCNPNLITYPVPGNDDTPVAVELYMRLFKESVLLGKQKRKEFEETPVWVIRHSRKQSFLWLHRELLAEALISEYPVLEHQEGT